MLLNRIERNEKLPCYLPVDETHICHSVVGLIMPEKTKILIRLVLLEMHRKCCYNVPIVTPEVTV